MTGWLFAVSEKGINKNKPGLAQLQAVTLLLLVTVRSIQDLLVELHCFESSCIAVDVCLCLLEGFHREEEAASSCACFRIQPGESAAGDGNEIILLFNGYKHCDVRIEGYTKCV